MKVGTDGVLLGAWCDLRRSDRRVLDAGTGTGLIALMVAQRCEHAHVTAIDIDRACVEQARSNIASSPWSDRVEASCADLRSYVCDTPFDHIVTNPPYFSSSLLPPDRARGIARHCTELSFADLAAAAVRLLCDDGVLSLILPAPAADEFIGLCRGRLYLVRRCDVRTVPHAPVKRSMLELSRTAHAHIVREELVIQTAPETFTDEYRRLTQDFYLKF